MKKSSLVILIIILVLVLLIAGVFALSLRSGKRDSRNDARSLVDNPADKSTTTSTTEKQIAITLYFVEDYQASMFLVAEQRSVLKMPDVQASAQTAIKELIKGPADEALKKKGAVSLIPLSTKVLSVAVANGTATVDFSREVLKANVGSEGEALGIYQIVNTLTEFPAIKSVRFTVEGKDSGNIGGRLIEDWWGHVGLSEQPFKRNTALMQGGKVETGTIRIASPRAYTTIENPVMVEGSVQVFEAVFQVCVKDMNDKVLADKQVMASDFNWGTFKKAIKYNPPQESGRGTVLFYYCSPKDGSQVTLGSVPVFLTK